MGCEGKMNMKDMMGMMSTMMEGCGPEKMTDMMTQCVGAMAQHIPPEKRTDFVLKSVDALMEKGTSGMSESEKKAFLGKVVERIKGRG